MSRIVYVHANAEGIPFASTSYAAWDGFTKLGYDGKTLLIKANDGHSLGNYNLHSVEYAKLLEARWDEMAHASP